MLFKGKLAKLKGARMLLDKIAIILCDEVMALVEDEDWRDALREVLTQSESFIRPMQYHLSKVKKLESVEWKKMYISTEDGRFRVVTEMNWKGKRSLKEEYSPNDYEIPQIAKILKFDVLDNQIVEPTEEQCEEIYRVIFG